MLVARSLLGVGQNVVERDMLRQVNEGGAFISLQLFINAS